VVLAVGILDRYFHVAIENIHTHLTKNRRWSGAVLESGQEVAVPLLVPLLCVVAVFPAFLRDGRSSARVVCPVIARGFGFAMIARSC